MDRESGSMSAARRIQSRRLLRMTGRIAACLAVATSAASVSGADGGVDFNRDVRPILSDKCFRCHGPDDQTREAGLRLDQRDAALKVLDSGETAIVPGQPDASRLVERIRSTDPAELMPPAEINKPLTDKEMDVLQRWIAEGAQYQTHWSFQPVTRPPVPEVRNPNWATNEIDRFVLAKLESEGLAPSAEATRETLIRRVTLDLTGLPPTIAEIDAFLSDTSANAYETVVDRLMTNPHYGERMALDWLDAARYADTHGYHIDSARDMTRWREWVIDAFNHNKPFDRFTVEQLAGDLLPDATLDQKIASGFNRNHMINYEGGAIPEEYHTAYIVDRVNTVGTVWLGLTVGCAQCHDHKYDPISQREFYGLYAFFHNVPEKGLDGIKGNAAPFLTLPSPQQTEELARLQAAIPELESQLLAASESLDAAQRTWEESLPADAAAMEALPDKIRSIVKTAVAERSDSQQTELRTHYRIEVAPDLRDQSTRLKQLRDDRSKLEKAIPTAMVMEEMPQPRDTFILVRGQYDKHGEKVVAAVPSTFPPLPDGAPANRLGLAEWLVSPTQPLMSRVTVNRYWQMFFGNGLVKTTEDFGLQGATPSHPELLDWLASEFMTGSGSESRPWDVKALIRRIVTSSTYRQSSVVTAELYARDPENKLLARGPRFRLQAEFLRDQALAVSGLMNPLIGGQSVSPYQPTGLWEELMSREDGDKFSAQKYVQSHGPDLYRRTMYTFWKRTCPPPTLATFDAPDRELCTVRRVRTNTPLQALVLLNDPTYVEASRKLAERILGPEGGESTDSRLSFAFRVVTGRQPKSDEVAILNRVLDGQLAKYQSDPAAAEKLLTVGESPHDASIPRADLAAWATLASVILNLDESVNRN